MTTDPRVAKTSSLCLPPPQQADIEQSKRLQSSSQKGHEPPLSPPPHTHHCGQNLMPLSLVPAGSSSRGGDVKVCVLDINQPSLPSPFTLLFCLFLSYGPFICISFHKSSRQLFAFSLCSPSLISALSVLSTTYLIYWRLEGNILRRGLCIHSFGM